MDTYIPPSSDTYLSPQEKDPRNREHSHMPLNRDREHSHNQDRDFDGEWESRISTRGQVYYYNIRTFESTWARPTRTVSLYWSCLLL